MQVVPRSTSRSRPTAGSRAPDAPRRAALAAFAALFSLPALAGEPVLSFPVEAGNGVSIDHGGGWETQYSHLRKGSVRVKPGETVRRGQPLGLIGLSGWTEFPHVHLSVRYNGRRIDPFVGVAEHTQCGLGAKPLWDAAALAALKYVPTGALSAGFTGAAPTLERIRIDAPPAPSLMSPALVFWIHAYGVRAGDEELIRLHGPDGAAIAERRRRIESNKAEWFTYLGRKRRDSAWPAGTYRAEYSITRQGERGAQQVLRHAMEIEVAP